MVEQNPQCSRRSGIAQEAKRGRNTALRSKGLRVAGGNPYSSIGTAMKAGLASSRAASPSRRGHSPAGHSSGRV